LRAFGASAAIWSIPPLPPIAGRIVKRTGDGSIIEFRSVVDAVRCAVEIQNGMAERNAGVNEDRRIEFRIGIHLGDVVEESDGDLMGDGVNIAARLEGICKPGAVCLSEDAYRQVKGRLDLAVSDLGPTQLKNIAEPVRVYSLEVGVPAQAKPSEPKRRLSPALIAVGIAALGVLAAASAWYFLNVNRPASVATKTPAEATRLSIVVTPFANLSGDPGQDYLVDALTDELTTSLARLRDTFVIARNTAMTFKGKPIDAKAIGKDLGVRYVLEGSVQPSGDRMRVNAQLIDAGSGGHLWAEQFDTPRADLLQTQDAIVAHLTNALDLQLQQAYSASVKRTPAANRDAEDLALQCSEGQWKAGFIGKEADAAYALCQQALAVDPNNVRALMALGAKFFVPVTIGVSGDPAGDLERADELESKALALDPDWTWPHALKGLILRTQGRAEEAVAEHERALALDPSNAEAAAQLGIDYRFLGRFDKSLEYLDRAMLASPHDPTLNYWYDSKAWANFGLKRYDQAIELARQALAINPKNPFAHVVLVAALALTDHDAEAREALQRYLAPPSIAPFKTIAAWRAYQMSQVPKQGGDPRFLEMSERSYEGLRKAGMPEE
jgi:adenylate cyclase